MKQRWLLGAVAALVVLLGVAWVQWVAPLRNAVAIGTSMLAKQMCTCVFVAGRGEAECRADQFSSMDAITVELDRERGLVHAFVTGLGERNAEFTGDLGCMLR